LYISDFIIIENYLGVAFSLLGIPIIIFILLMLTLFINFGYKLDNNSIINKRNTPEHTEENEKIELNKKRRTTMIVIMGGINFLLFFVSVGILLYSIKIL
jgi:membrane protein insertase Oxa1/YidC/SpoIIIJ